MNSKGWFVCFSVLTASLLLGGCTRTYTWKEEVTLKSGEKLIVERSQKYSTGGEWGTSTLWNTIEKARIRIDGVPVEWVGNNYPMIVERWEGKYVVVYIGRSCASYFDPDPRRYIPPYYIDAFINGRWQEVDVFQVREIWSRNLVYEWRKSGFLADESKARKLRSERSSVKSSEVFDLSIKSGCRPPPLREMGVGK